MNSKKVARVSFIMIFWMAVLVVGVLFRPNPTFAQESLLDVEGLVTCTFPIAAGTEAELDAAIDCFNAITDPDQYTITFTDNISLTANLPDVQNSMAGVSLLIAGDGFALDAQNSRRTIRISANTHATFDRLTVMNGNNAVGANILNSGTLTLTNSTVTGGTASNLAAGINNFGATLTLINSTVAGNSATNGGGGIRISGGSSVTLINSIVADNAGDDCDGTIGISHNSLIGDNTCGVTGGVNGNIVNVDAKLAPLAEVDGALVHALQSGSPASAGGDAASCPTIDQRGAARPQPANSVCDMGSYEADLASLIRATKSAETILYNGELAIAYTIVVSNTGNAPIAGGVIEDFLPAGLTLITDTMAIDPANAGTLTSTLPTIVTDMFAPVGQLVTVTYKTEVTETASFGDTFLNAATVTDNHNIDYVWLTQAVINLSDPCDIFPASVATEAQFNGAIVCYNNRTAAGQYTIALTDDITVTAELTSIDNPTDGVQLLIDGNGFALDGDDSARLLHIVANTVVTVDDATIRNGNGSSFFSANGSGGGGIKSSGTLTVSNSHFIANSATNNVGSYEGAGAIDVISGTLTVQNSTFTNNDGSSDGGAISGEANTDISVADSTFENNISDREGGAIHALGSLTVTNSDFTGNESGQEGGALYVEGGGATAQVSGSRFHSNITREGGAISVLSGAVVTIDNSDLISNEATQGGSGGALHVKLSAVLTVTNSSLLNNRLVNGGSGAIYIEAPIGTLMPSNVSISTSCIVNNDDVAVYLEDYGQLATVANDNWWGHATGPNIELERHVFNGALGDSAETTITIDRFETAPLARCPDATREAVDLSHIEVEKTVYPAIAQTFELITYTIRITNTGAVTQTGLIALDDLPANVYLNDGIDYDFGPSARSAEEPSPSPSQREGDQTSPPSGGIEGGLRNGTNTFTHDLWFWPVDTLNPGQSITITFGARALAQGDQTLTNTALVTTRRTPNPVTDTADVNYTDTCDVFPATVTDTHSLHDAILCFSTRQTPGTYEVSFANAITLDAAVASIWNPSDGVALHIDGNGFTLDGDERYRGFNINDGDVTIDNLTIQNGRADSEDGGAIRHWNGTLMLTNSTLTNNLSTRAGGGMVVYTGTVTISNTQIISNVANAQHQAAAGGGLAVLGGNVTVQSSDISHNVDTFSLGGGVYLRGSATLAIEDSRVANNRSPGAGGIFMRDWYGVDPHLTLLRTTVEGNDGYAGGLRVEDGFVDIIDSTFSNNISEAGGAIYNEADVSIVNSTISGNQGIDLDNNRDGRTARGGGTVVAGIRNEGTITMTNVTIVNNYAISNDNCCIDEVAGGFYNRRTATLHNVLLADNVGEYALDPIPGHLRELGNCHLLVATTVGADTMADDDSCGGATQVADAMVGTLADNGPSTSSGTFGPPQTHLLLSGSPAIGAGDTATCAATDQRGMARPLQSGCDIGAVQVSDYVGFTATQPVGQHEGDPSTSPSTSSGGASGVTTFEFEVQRSSFNSAETLAYTVGPDISDPIQAAEASDFVGDVFPAGTVDFGGNLTTTLIISVTGDLTVEFEDRFVVTLTQQTRELEITQATAFGRIYNDDIPTGTVEDVMVDESAGFAVLTMTLDRPFENGYTGVYYSTISNTATAPQDYEEQFFTSFEFGSGGITTTAAITIPIFEDTEIEGNETFTVSVETNNFFPELSQRGGNNPFDVATVTIIDNDKTTVTLSQPTALPEGDAGTTVQHVFTATLIGQTEVGFDLPFTLSDGSATADDGDYVGNDGVLTFAGTAGETQLITVTVIGDNNVEGDEVFSVALGAAGVLSNVVTAGPAVNGTILNDDVSLENAPPTANDNSYLTVENSAISGNVISDDTGDGIDDDGGDGGALSIGSSSLPSSGTLDLNIDGSFTFTPSLDFNGTVVFTYTVSDGIDASEGARVTISVQSAVLGDNLIWETSSSVSGSVGGIDYGPEDVIRYDERTDSWSMVFDGSEYGISADIDAYVRLNDRFWAFSFAEPTMVPGIDELVDDSDVVIFKSISGNFKLLVDGSDIGLETDDENIDALGFANKTFYFSTVGDFDTGTIAGGPEDIFVIDPRALGEATAGDLMMYVDGSELGYTEHVRGLSLNHCLAAEGLAFTWFDTPAAGLYGVITGGALALDTSWAIDAGYAPEEIDAFAFGSGTCPVRSSDVDLIHWLIEMGIDNDFFSVPSAVALVAVSAETPPHQTTLTLVFALFIMTGTGLAYKRKRQGKGS